jgi:hypothetical protein
MKKTKYLKIAVMAIGASVMLSSCATLINGRTQKMSFHSEPAGAQVMKGTGEVLCSETPCEAYVKRSGNNMILKFTKQGYIDSFAPVIAGVSAWYWLDCVPAGVPAIVDLFTGGAYYYPNQVSTTLQRMSGGGGDGDGEAVEM